MFKKERLFPNSAKAKFRTTFLLVVVFALMAFVIAGGNYYNQAASWLSGKTGHVVSLPQVKEMPFIMGLDLQGGTQLVYEADVTGIAENERMDDLESVRDRIERRVNASGVSEPVVQINRTISGDYRVIAELAGIKDVNEAIRTIGATPLLEFKEIDAVNTSATSSEPVWQNTEVTGKYLAKTSMQFNQNDGSPEVSLTFDSDGAEKFKELTARNVGQPIAIFLDGYPIQIATVSSEIPNGQAIISGSFSVQEAKLLVQRLKDGALPVPITLVSQQVVGASLGQSSVSHSYTAGLYGFLFVALFMVLLYRFPGLISVASLLIYVLVVLSIFKLMPFWLSILFIILLLFLFASVFNELKIFDGIMSVLMFLIIALFLIYYAKEPVTLTLAGITGFILSIGMAVDANILIFERMKEELRQGKPMNIAIDDGFKRAWPSIRDGNITTILTCFVLMTFGTGLVKGFGATLFVGVSVSMFSSIVVTRTLMKLFGHRWLEKYPWLVGIKKVKA
jgi:protein-export membrane protein SecD